MAACATDLALTPQRQSTSSLVLSGGAFSGHHGSLRRSGSFVVKTRNSDWMAGGSGFGTYGSRNSRTKGRKVNLLACPQNLLACPQNLRAWPQNRGPPPPGEPPRPSLALSEGAVSQHSGSFVVKTCSSDWMPVPSSFGTYGSRNNRTKGRKLNLVACPQNLLACPQNLRAWPQNRRPPPPGEPPRPPLRHAFHLHLRLLHVLVHPLHHLLLLAHQRHRHGLCRRHRRKPRRQWRRPPFRHRAVAAGGS